jgi:hypothetical protein
MRTTFEEACTLSKTMVTAEKLTSLGPVETMRLYSEKLAAEFGWTIGELCEEARIRMHARIVEMRRCACGHADDRHIECVDFTAATGCFGVGDESCPCMKYTPRVA